MLFLILLVAFDPWQTFDPVNTVEVGCSFSRTSICSSDTPYCWKVRVWGRSECGAEIYRLWLGEDKKLVRVAAYCERWMEEAEKKMGRLSVPTPRPPRCERN